MKDRRYFLTRCLMVIVAIFAIGIFTLWWWQRRTTVTVIKPPSNVAVDAWPAPTASDNDWPWWRGPQYNGEAKGITPPLNWSVSQNIKWKQPVPGRGHASPIIWGSQIFLFTADDPAQKLTLCAYSRDAGTPLWSALLHTGGFPIKHPKNSHASSTPACDGTHVYAVAAVNDSVLVTACTLDGKIAWQTSAGPFLSENGFGSSPLLWGPYLIVVADSSPLSLRRFASSPSFIAALDRRTGQLIWRVPRALGHSYGTPILATVSGKEQVLVSGPEAIISYDPASGDENWRFPWSASRTTNTVAASADRLLATMTLPSRLTVCLRGDGTGTLHASQSIWKSERYVCEVPSPMLRNDRVFLFEDNGIATCLASGDGKLLWKDRLGSGETLSASPVVQGKAIYIAAESGKTYVVEDGPAFKLLATNDLAEEQIATPAIAGGEIFLRTSQHLWCISQQKAANRP